MAKWNSRSLAQKQHEMKQKLEGYVSRPTAVEGVAHTANPRAWVYDPSYVLKEDIKDQDGDVIHKAGAVINPLDKIVMPYELLFIDADSDSQVSWALEYDKANEKPCRIILVRGAPMELMKQYKTRMYFDQKGILTGRFGITQVPAMVRQQENKLAIEELQLRRN